MLVGSQGHPSLLVGETRLILRLSAKYLDLVLRLGIITVTPLSTDGGDQGHTWYDDNYTPLYW